jgi:general secretion pathway protein D
MKKTKIIALSTLLGMQSALAQMDEPAGMDSGMPNSPSQSASKNLMSNREKSKFNNASLDDITNENFPQVIESFDFPNGEISDVIKTISELMGKNFIIDPGVRGKITIIAPSKITVAEAYRAFLSALAINGFTVVPSGNFLKVKSARDAQRDSIETYSGSYFPNTDQMITRIIHLKHISAAQVNKDLRILPSKHGEMSVYEPTNSIILSDYGSNVERVMRIINQLDVPGFEEQLEVIPIRFAKAKDIADLVDKIVNKGGSNGSRAGSFSAGVPRFSRSSGASSQQGASFFMVIPDDRTNSLIVVGNKPGILRLKKLIAQLDFKIRPEDAGGVYVYYVKHGEAEKIQQTMMGLAKDAKTGSTAAPAAGGAAAPSAVPQEIFGGDVKITADKNTNSLIITASKQDYDVVLNLLSKIDIPRDQVYVEAIIMEMSMNDSAAWGVGYYKFDKASNGVGRAGFNGFDNIGSLLNPTGGKGAILGFGSGETITVNTGASQTQITSLVGFINFLKTVGRTNILSTPQIMALDNNEAEIEVGDKVPTSTSSTIANGQTNTSINFENATIKLKIKPFISPSSSSIRMEIDQKVKQLSTKTPPAKDLANAAAVLTDRSLKTSIVVNSGDTAVLGGLVRDEEQESVTKVPVLGDIPILGWLFKSRSISKEKVNLVVFITPKIIRNPSDNRQLLSRKLDQRLDFIKASGGRDPYGDVMNEIGKRTAEAASVDPSGVPAFSSPSQPVVAPIVPPAPVAEPVEPNQGPVELSDPMDAPENIETEEGTF